ncbi:MAG: ankyrin repeat domain-containing protein [Wolbachia endosymbiont of Xenopsylla cheopis]
MLKIFIPLHYSIKPGYEEIVDKKWCRYEDCWLIHLAAKECLNEILKMLIKNGGYADAIDKDLNTPLHIAVLNNCENVVEILLQNSANVNAQGEYDCTPLHLAVIKGNKRIVEILLKKQANIYLEVNYNGITMTALDIAQANKNKEIEQLLLSFIIGTDYIPE